MIDIVVVEGKKDSEKIKKLFNVLTYETHGFGFNDSDIENLKKLSKTYNVILFLDPDRSGEKIRQSILKHIPDAENIYISKNDMEPFSKKIGVAEAKDEVIIKAFQNKIKFKKDNISLLFSEYLSLDISSKILREKICEKIGISYCNNKTLFKTLNMLNIDLLRLKEIIKDLHG
jgi:ribonuclease M5